MERLTLFDQPHSTSRPHFARAPAPAYLEVIRGRVRRRLRPINAPAFLVGSALDCDLVLGDSRFPARHHLLLTAEQSFWLVHLGAGPPLLVDGEPIDWRRAVDGNRIATGEFEFQLHVLPPRTPTDAEREERTASPVPLPPRILRLLNDLRTAVAHASRAG